MKDELDKLRPCHLCGGGAVMRRDDDPEYPWYVTFNHDGDCPMYAVPTDMFRSYPTEAEAVAAWNTRAPSAQAERANALEAALEWYGEQARLCRLINSVGDVGRFLLSEDGGERARAALQQTGADHE